MIRLGTPDVNGSTKTFRNYRSVGEFRLFAHPARSWKATNRQREDPLLFSSSNLIPLGLDAWAFFVAGTMRLGCFRE